MIDLKHRVFKTLIATSILLPTVVSVASNPAEASTTTKIDQAVQKAISTKQVLRRACSMEYNADGKTRPYQEYNAAKAAYNEAIKLVNKLSNDKKQIYLAKLDEAQLQIKRAGSYIDAITGGKKIEEKKVYLQSQLKQGILSAETLKAYHELSFEIKKQAFLLDRVYGVTTREAIRDYYKESAEQLRDELSFAVTVKMSLEKVKTASATDSATLLKEAKSILTFLEVIPQPTYKKDLKAEWQVVSGKIPASVQDEEYLNLVAVHESLGELESLIKPGVSDVTVPALYQATTEQIENVQNDTAKTSFGEKLRTVMEGLFLSPEEIKGLLTKKAIENGIPPEIVKSIALTENAGFEQFLPNGDVFTSIDNGYGIMQVTPLSPEDTRFDWNRIKYDINYNIDTGIKILLEKWNYGGTRIPVINDGNKDALENWYFAIMAYNGLSKRNDPGLSERTYQGKVYTNMKNYAQVSAEVINKEAISISYNESTGQMLFTNKMLYKTNTKTKSNQVLKSGDQPTIGTDVRFREQPSTTGAIKSTLASGTKLTILEGPIEDPNKNNLFVWYKVKVNSTGEVGYVASVWGQGL